MSSSFWSVTNILTFESYRSMRLRLCICLFYWSSMLDLDLSPELDNCKIYLFEFQNSLYLYIFRIFNRYILCELTANLLRQFSCQLETILFSKTNVKLSTGNVRYILVMQNEALFYYQHNSPLLSTNNLFNGCHFTKQFTLCLVSQAQSN